MACSECQGRGEYPLYESLKLASLDSCENRNASCSAPLGRWAGFHWAAADQAQSDRTSSAGL